MPLGLRETIGIEYASSKAACVGAPHAGRETAAEESKLRRAERRVRPARKARARSGSRRRRPWVGAPGHDWWRPARRVGARRAHEFGRDAVDRVWREGGGLAERGGGGAHALRVEHDPSRLRLLRLRLLGSAKERLKAGKQRRRFRWRRRRRRRR
eukprot:1736943-Prymnesium_polylepis.1